MNKTGIYLGQGAVLKGTITWKEDCSVWYNAVIRADGSSCTIGSRVNIQDLVMIHADHASPVVIEDDVSVGHSAVLHGCTIGEGSIIGMGSILLDGCVIGKHCMVAAGTLVPQNRTYPDNVLLLGSPAKIIRTLSEEEIQKMKDSALHYTEEAKKQLTLRFDSGE